VEGQFADGVEERDGDAGAGSGTASCTGSACVLVNLDPGWCVFRRQYYSKERVTWQVACGQAAPGCGSRLGPFGRLGYNGGAPADVGRRHSRRSQARAALVVLGGEQGRVRSAGLAGCGTPRRTVGRSGGGDAERPGEFPRGPWERVKMT